jgi:hypothetical protein
LLIQKNKEKIKELIRETILNTIRDNIPIEKLLRAYLDETTEVMDEPKKVKKEDKSLRFSETNMAMSTENEESVYVPPEREPEERLKLEDITVEIPVEDLNPKPIEAVPILELTELVEPKEPKEPEIVLDIQELC